jgi:hypothetical protein
MTRPLFARPIRQRYIKVLSLTALRLERIARSLRRRATALTNEAVDEYRTAKNINSTKGK